MNLHEVIFQIVNNPQLANQIAQNSQLLWQNFKVSPAEAEAIVALLQNSRAMELLLTAQALPAAAVSSIESAWIPPHWP